MTDVITLAATPAAIIALVNLARKLGLPPKAALVLAMSLGIAFALSDLQFGALGWYRSAVDGMLIGLAAAGLHDLAGRAGTAHNRVTEGVMA